MMNREIVMEIVKILVMFMSVVITTYVIPWIKANTDNQKLQTILDWVEQGVHAAEQIYGAESGTMKKRYVSDYIKMIAEAKHINIRPEEIDMLIEAAVRQMRTEDYIMVEPEDYEAIIANAE